MLLFLRRTGTLLLGLVALLPGCGLFRPAKTPMPSLSLTGPDLWCTLREHDPSVAPPSGHLPAASERPGRHPEEIHP